jgi:hypothetical protein
MRNRITALVATLALFCCTIGVNAQVPEYSFETIAPSGANPPGPDGFFGLGATVTQDVIGATHLTKSMKYDVGVGGFVGARTEIVPPTINNPPGVNHILFDVTLPQTYTDTFANIGVTLFGHALNPGGPGTFGNQVQFQDDVELAGLAAGTHLNQRIDLDTSVGPYRPGESFDQIFGPVDPNDLTFASAFQFYINKNVLTPITVYIDNVRFVPVPEPTGLSLVALAGVALTGLRRRS